MSKTLIKDKEAFLEDYKDDITSSKLSAEDKAGCCSELDHEYRYDMSSPTPPVDCDESFL